MLYLAHPHWLKPEIIPGLPFRWYGLMYIVVFLVTWYFFRRQVREEKVAVNNDEISAFFVWGFVGILLGSRVFFALVYDTSREMISKPWLIVWPFQNGQFVGFAGMSFHGGLIGSIVGVFLYALRHKRFFFQWLDWIVGGFPLGYTFGRLGNFINGELWGRVTASPLGMIFPQASGVPVDNPEVIRIAEQVGMDLSEVSYINREGVQVVNLPRHPSQLYEALLEGVVIWVLIWFFLRPLKRSRNIFHGFLSGVYLIGYGTARIIAEYFRQPDADKGFLFGGADAPIWMLGKFTWMTTGQFYSWLLVLAGLLILFFASKFHKARLAAGLPVGEPLIGSPQARAREKQQKTGKKGRKSRISKPGTRKK